MNNAILSWSFLLVISCELNFITWKIGCCCRGAMCTTRTKLQTADNRCSAFLNSSCTYWAWGITKRMIIFCDPLVYIPFCNFRITPKTFSWESDTGNSVVFFFIYFYFLFTDQSDWNVIVPQHSRDIFFILGFLIDPYFISSYTSQSHA